MKTREDEMLKKMLDSLLDNTRESTSKNVFVISGPPGAGKTTYVLKHKDDKDLVVDLDYICAALNATQELYQSHEYVLDLALQLQETVYKAIEKRAGKWSNAYVITAMPDKTDVKKLVGRLNGQLISIDATKEQCIENILNDERRNDKKEIFVNLVNQYFEKNKV